MNLDDLRQRMFPEPFRIGPADWPADLRGALEKLQRASEPGAGGAEDRALLLGLATELFRLRQKMLKPGTNEPVEEMRRAFRHVEAMGDLFAQADLEIQDHTGTRFEVGLDLTVVAYQPQAGLDREVVIETLRPSIYFRGQPLQRGEVVVGKPEPPAAEPKGGTPPA